LTLALTIESLRASYAQGAQVRDILAGVRQRIIEEDPTIWISLTPSDLLEAQAERLDTLDGEARNALPLFGVPFAVKDNIDVAGLPTTAACPDFSYEPDGDATVVGLLLAAGAVIVGKTNLDQFASGLVGTRSPYGIPRNPFDPRMVPGGSSSGSAVAVAQGLVCFALGTDTAGSGRVPAGFTNTVGLKPTRGVLSAHGLVPACRSLDCVSIFARNVSDAMAVFAVTQGPDVCDPLSRSWAPIPPCEPRFRFAALDDAQVAPFGSLADAQAYHQGIARLEAIGGTRVSIDFEPCRVVGDLLYGGPFVAERHAAIGAFFDAHPESLWPVTRRIIEGAKHWTASELFSAMRSLDQARAQARAVFEAADVFYVPTVPGRVTLEEDALDPRGRSTMLGSYTNFVNFFDWSALAIPSAFHPDGFPIGATLIAPPHGEQRLAALGARYLAASVGVAA
jgi:allophanate hydrolase